MGLPVWTALPGHADWLRAERLRLLGHAARSRVPGGFGWLDDDGAVDPARGVELVGTARMTHVFSLGHLLGVPGCGPLADHGVRALAGGPLRDADRGGWYPALDASGGPGRGRRTAYGHAFVLLAASSALAAGRDGADDLLADAQAVVERRFWAEEEGAVRESWARDWTDEEDYRGANATMHSVEAFLAVADATGQEVWAERAGRMARRIAAVCAAHRWRLPEHFDGAWRPLRGYHRDDPAHPFRPFGTTPGHWLEWSRLLVQLAARRPDPPPWADAAARGLFAAAAAVAWAADGHPGFPYTLDDADRPVVAERLHWVAAEAVCAAAALHARTGEDAYADAYRRWWDHAAGYFVDPDRPGWRHERAPDGTASARIWAGRPDAYHAVQATVLPLLPPGTSVAAALRAGAGG